MNTKKQKPTQHGYTADDLVRILDQAIPLYQESPNISFHTTLETLCTYKKTHWKYWTHERTEKDPRILERFQILRDIQEQKTINGAMIGDYNPAFSMFLLKCKYGYCEEQHKARLELDKRKLDQDKELATIQNDILIGFTSESNN